jgi:hypothetical protein
MMSLPDKEKTPEQLRQEQIRLHCEQQNCDGCPGAEDCDREGEEEIARQEEEAYNTMEEEEFDF